MKRLKRQVWLLPVLVLFIACVLASVFFLLPRNAEQVKADLEIGPSNKSEYLVITEEGVLTGFQKKPTEPYSLKIPKEVVEISNEVFKGTSLTGVTYEAGRASENLKIGASAFQDCRSLQSVDLPKGTAPAAGAAASYTIGASAFKGCTSLTAIDFPVGADTVANSTFEDCTSLKRVTLGSNIHTIGTNAFHNAMAMIDLGVTSGIQKVGDTAFWGCQSLTKIDLSGLTSALGSEAFKGCVKLAEVKVPTENASNADGALAWALNSYSDNSGQSMHVTTPDGFVFCQKTSSITKERSFISSGFTDAKNLADSFVLEDAAAKHGNDFIQAWQENYKNGDWYLISYEGDASSTTTPLVLPETFNDGGGGTVEKYNINRYAFFWSGGNIKIPKSVVKIGNFAFLHSPLAVMDLSDATGLTHIGAMAFAYAGHPVLYLPDRQTQANSLYVGYAVSTSAVPVHIVAPNYAAFDAMLKSNRSCYGSFTGELTYLVPIRLHYTVDEDGKVSDAVTETEKRLLGKEYYYVQDRTSKTWDYDTSVKLPLQDGYSSSVWYSSADDRTNTALVTSAGLNALLMPSVKGNVSIDLYADTVKKPNQTNPKESVTIPTVTYPFQEETAYGIDGVSGVNSLLQNNGLQAYEIDKRAKILLQSYANAKGVPTATDDVENIKNAGTYVFSIQLHSEYGTWAEPVSFTVVIEQQTIDLSKKSNHTFLLDENRPLREGTLYFKEDSSVPYQDSSLPIEREVENSYVRDNGRVQSIFLDKTLMDFKGEVFSVQSEIMSGATPKDPNTYSTLFTLELEGDNANNYLFVMGTQSSQEELEKRGVTIKVYEYAATMMKQWYIVKVDNYFSLSVPQGTVEPASYTVQNWAYGDGTAPAPYVYYGGQDKISFTLRYKSANNVALTGIKTGMTDDDNTYSDALERIEYTKDKFEYYINSSMPVGRYELVLYYPEVWTLGSDTFRYTAPEDTDYVYHEAIYTPYTFDVTEASLKNARVAGVVDVVHGALQDKKFEFEYDKEKVQLFDTAAENKIKALTEFTGLIVPRKGIWENGNWDEYFDKFKVTYNLESSQTTTYYTQDGLMEEQKPNRYVVYYQIEAPNYLSLANVNTDNSSDDRYRRQFTFTATVRKGVATPTIDDDKIYFTGSAISPYIQYDNDESAKAATYSVAWDHAEGCTQGGAHAATVTLQGEYYYWAVNGKEGERTVTVQFTIHAATNSWALTPVMNGWTYSQDATSPNAKSYYGNDTIQYTYCDEAPTLNTDGTVTLPDQKHVFVSFEKLRDAHSKEPNKHLDAGTYWVVGSVQETDNYTGLAHVTSFTVARRATTAPALAEATYNGQAQKVYQSGTQNELVDTDDYEVTLPKDDMIFAGTYTITLKLKDTTNYVWLSGKEEKDETIDLQFIVNPAQNSWKQSPSVISWQWNGFDREENLFSALPNYWQETKDVKDAEKAVKWFIYSDPAGDKPVELTYDGDLTEEPQYLQKGFTLDYLEDSKIWAVPAWVAELLNGFEAKTWYVRAVVTQGHDSRREEGATQIDFEEIGSKSAPVPFVILVASNSWKESPTVRGWSYRGFNNGITVTKATPTYGDNDVTYTVYLVETTDGKRTETEKLTFAQSKFIRGNELDEDTKNGLNTLTQGEYKLTVTVAARANRYKKFEQSYTFTVSKAPNAITADLENWTYGTTDIHFTVSYPAQAVGVGATYTLVGKEFHEEYRTAEEFLDAMKNAAHFPDAGDYTLTITVAESVDYASSQPREISFKILPAKNGWENEPAFLKDKERVTAWSFGDTVTADFAAVHRGGTATVTYYKAIQSGGNYREDLSTATSALPTAAGHYFIKVAYTGVKNYGDIEKTVYFRIDKGTNEFDPVPALEDFTYKDTTIAWTRPQSKFELAANEKITVSIDGGAAIELSDVEAKLKALPAGTHSLVAMLPETANFDAVISQPVNFTVKEATIVWTAAPSVTGWEWKSVEQSVLKNHFSYGTVSTSGVTVSAVITDGNGNTYLLDNMANANAGTYTLTVTASRANFENSVKTVQFTVSPAVNDWESPLDLSKRSWEYGKKNVTVENTFGTVTAKHGSVVISFYDQSDESTTFNDLPTVVGKYYIVFTVAEDTAGNYSGKTDKIEFEITGSSETAWEVGFGVSSQWSWNEYDKQTNVFKGVPRSGGAVSYSIYDEANNVEKIPLFSLDNDGYVTDEVAAKLKELTAGKYTLRVYVAKNGGYASFDDKTTIEIYPAENAWNVSPSIAPWVVGEWQDAGDNSVGNVPQGLPKYGVALFEIKDAAGNVYYSATRQTVGNSVVFKEDKKVNEFRDSIDGSLAGRYFLHVTVAAEDGKFKGKEEVIQFQVFAASEEIPSNHWLVIPKIDNWTAGDFPSIPRALPLRGSAHVTFTFYVLNFDENKQEWTQGEEIAYADIVSAGRYRMEVTVYKEDKTNRDYMSAQVDFSVDKRVNNWTVSPSIENWFLANGANSPVYETTENSEITVLYKLKDAADSTAVPEVPTAAGNYTMIVTAKAPYCDDLKAEYDFKVMLATNTWEKIPTIENWSEEFDPNNPTAEATFGEVTYTYFTKDGKQLDEKPTTEGTYIMRATVEAFGYTSLTEEVEFTIEPAFDMTFVLIDAALGVVAVIASIVLISVILKRRKK